VALTATSGNGTMTPLTTSPVPVPVPATAPALAPAPLPPTPIPISTTPSTVSAPKDVLAYLEGLTEIEAVALKNRMLKIASEVGLSRGVSNDSVNLTMKALESYLKEILSNCSSVVQVIGTQPATTPFHHLHQCNILHRDSSFAPTATGLPSQSQPPPRPAEETDKEIRIGVRELFTTIELHPYLLGENHPITQERVACLY